MDRLSSAIEQQAKANYGDVSRLKLRYQPPRMCKIADGMIDPSVHDFGLRVWLQTKVGETSEYALAPRAYQSRETPFMTAQERARGTDFTVVGEPVDGDIRKAVYEVFDFTVDKEGMIDILKQGRAILGTISMYTGDGSVDSHGNAYLLVPEIINHPQYGNRPPTFYILETYKFHSDEVAKAFEYYFDDVFDPYNRLGQKVEVWRMNAIALQKFDPLCMSWSIMMLYYLAKMPIPQNEMVGDKVVTVEKPLHLNVAVPSLINRAIAKLKADMGGQFLPPTATATAFPYLFGSGTSKITRDIKRGDLFKHSTDVKYPVFRHRFMTSEYIWAYRYNAVNEHRVRSFYMECEDPIKVFDLTTAEGANHFRDVLKDLSDPTLLDLFEDKIVNYEKVVAGTEAPKYRSRSARADRQLADGLAFYRETHGVDGWVLKLTYNDNEEYLFLYPSVYFRPLENIPDRR